MKRDELVDGAWYVVVDETKNIIGANKARKCKSLQGCFQIGSLIVGTNGNHKGMQWARINPEEIFNHENKT